MKNIISKPPKPDPCLVDFWVGNTRAPKEKDWIKARNCEYGCGEKCILLDNEEQGGE